MTRMPLPRRPVLCLVVSMLAAASLGQAPAVRPQFEPKVGQEGKDVVWVPTPQAVVDKMLDLAKVTRDDYVIDLGSGDGRTVISAAKRGARAHGIEYNPEMVTLSQRTAAAQGVSASATFAKADLFESDFSRATVITMFLLPSINLRLRPKLLDLKPGTRIVSNTFLMDDWQPDQSETVASCERYCTAHLWIVPARMQGTWQSDQGELVLTQQFQNVSGRLVSGGSTTMIAGGKLQGDQITFSAGGAQYAGRVSGNTVEGTLTAQGASTRWRATRSVAN